MRKKDKIIANKLDDYYKGIITKKEIDLIENYTHTDWSQFLYAVYKRAMKKYPKFKNNIEQCMMELMPYLKVSNEPRITRNKLKLFLKTLNMFKTPFPLTLYRGTEYSYLINSSIISSFEKNMESLKVGSSITNVTPLSTSLDFYCALSFSCDTVLEIHLPVGNPGIWVKNFSFITDEYEFIIPPDMELEIISTKPNNNLISKIIYEEAIEHYYVLQAKRKRDNYDNHRNIR